jgi:DNA-binding NarL/FixJ family response regulator
MRARFHLARFAEEPDTFGLDFRRAAQPWPILPHRHLGVRARNRPASPAPEDLLSIARSPVSASGREREVMALVVAGLLNKQVGSDLGISEITVKAHRGRMMQRMKADSLADLVKMAARLGLDVRRKSYDAL